MKQAMFWFAVACFWTCMGAFVVALWQLAPGPVEQFAVFPLTGFTAVVLVAGTAAARKVFL